jgi:NHL repeat
MPSSALIFTVVGTGEASYTGDGGVARDAGLNQPFDVALDQQGHLYFSEADNHCVRRVEGHSGIITTVAGTGQAGYSGDGGPALRAQMQEPNDIVLDGKGRAFIADVRDHRVRVVDLASGNISTFAGTGEGGSAGDGGPASRAALLGPRALAFGPMGDLYICLRNDHKVRQVEMRTGIIRTVAGTGERGYTGDHGPALRATFNGPKEIAVDRQNNIVLVDTENHCIRRIETVSGVVTTVAGTGQAGGSGDGGPATAATLKRPHGACLDEVGNIFIGDSENHRVRFMSILGEDGLPW